MSSPTPARSVRLKNEILRGVFAENQRINSAKHIEPVRFARQRAARRNRRLAVLSLLLIVCLTAVAGRFFFNSGGKDALMAPVAIASMDPDTLPIKTIEVRVPVQADYGRIPSYILRPQHSDTVQISPERLLDYSLMLNNGDVRLSSIFGLDVQTIVIDPGHGGKDPGAIGSMGTKEKDIVLDIALRLRDHLIRSGKYHVILTRDEDKTMSLAERVELANAGRTDLFISLHVNALPQKRANLIETYYYGPPSDAETLRLAEQENRGSGIQTSAFETMIEKIGNTVKEQESASLATAIQHSLFTNVKKYDKDIADAGIKIAPFVVLLGVNAPSVLVEISCISKKEEELKLNLPAYREEITSFIAQGTIRYLARRNVHFVKGEENDQKIRSKSS